MTMLFYLVFVSFVLLQNEVWSSPFPQQTTNLPRNTTTSTNSSIPTNLTPQQQTILKNDPPYSALGPSVFGLPPPNNINQPSSYVNGYTNPGNIASLGLTNLQRIPQQNNHRQQLNGNLLTGSGGDANSPIQFSGRLTSSMGNLAKGAINAKTQSASQVMDGVAFGLSRVPSFVGYGVEGFGRLEKAGEHLFKAAVDLGIGGVTNGMEGMATGMNIVNGLSTAGVKGITTLASGSAKIVEHIISLGQTENGLINTLIALSRLMSPSRMMNFQNSGLSLDTLVGAAKYLGIPMNNANLNTILSVAQRIQNSGVSLDSVRQAATSAVNNLGLSTAWQALTSRLNTNGNGGNVMQAINAAAQSNRPLPPPPSIGLSANAQSLTDGGIPSDLVPQVVEPTTGGWLSWLGG